MERISRRKVTGEFVFSSGEFVLVLKSSYRVGFVEKIGLCLGIASKRAGNLNLFYPILSVQMTWMGPGKLTGFLK